MTAIFIDKALSATRGFKRRPLKREVEEQRQDHLRDLERHLQYFKEGDRRILETFLLKENGASIEEFRRCLIKHRAFDLDFLFLEMSRDAVLGMLIDTLPY